MPHHAKTDRSPNTFTVFRYLKSSKVMLFFVLDLACDPLRQTLDDLLDAKTDRTGRKYHGTWRTLQHGHRTTASCNQSIPCWPFVGRGSRPRRLNF
jgi:hypothetical protein